MTAANDNFKNMPQRASDEEITRLIKQTEALLRRRDFKTVA